MLHLAEAPLYHVAVVTPVYDDWPSFFRLLQELARELPDQRILVIGVDDGSVEPVAPDAKQSGLPLMDIRIVRLAINLGHQRAIAVGLAEATKYASDSIVVMDADGEDRPRDIPRLLDMHRNHPAAIIVARRAKREESLSFRLFYAVYKFAFRLCTGVAIAHGNFSLIPRSRLSALLHTGHTWNNLAASIVRSRIPYLELVTDRGERYEGRSKMNFLALLMHGLSAISVYLDVFAARLLVFCVAAIGLLAVSSLAVVFFRVFTPLYVPGWSSLALGIAAILATQLTALTAGALFFHLAARAQASVIPAVIAESYVESVTTLEAMPA